MDDEDFETRLSEIEQFDIIARELEDGNDIRHSGAWFLAQLEVQDDGEEATKRYVQIRRQSMSDPGRAQLWMICRVSEEWGQQQLHRVFGLRSMSLIRRIRKFSMSRTACNSSQTKKETIRRIRKTSSQENEKQREINRRGEEREHKKKKKSKSQGGMSLFVLKIGFKLPLEWGWTLTKNQIENKKSTHTMS